jgi:hypothetical protein
MKIKLYSQIILLLTASVASHADEADEIVSHLGIKLLPDVSEKFEPKEQMEEEKNRRERANAKMGEVFADHFREEMTDDELSSTLEFLKTPEGKKLALILNTGKLQEPANQILETYRKEAQNQSH